MARPKKVKEGEQAELESAPAMPLALNSDLQEIQDRAAGMYKKQ